MLLATNGTNHSRWKSSNYILCFGRLIFVEWAIIDRGCISGSQNYHQQNSPAGPKGLHWKREGGSAANNHALTNLAIR